MTVKSELRREVKNMLVALSDDQRREKSEKAVSHLVSFLVQKFSQLSLQKSNSSTLNIGLFAPMKDEVDILEGLSDQLNKEWQGSVNWETSFPYGEQQVMDFRRCKLESLEESLQFGVKIRTPKISDPIAEPDILIIPGMAFTKSGHRLGRGKGFYDRYLERFTGPKVGVCFEEQVREDIPHEPHDQLMDYLVSDNGIFDCE